MRKLACIRKIDELNPIEGADKIEVATVGGWKVVAQKGLYNVGDLAVYFEIDSWIPSKVAPFLTKAGHYPKVFEGVEGERLKTIKLRGQISQGLMIPLSELCKLVPGFEDITTELDDMDVTELLGIKKWEKPMSAQLAGTAKGNFPSRIPKTDQERCQNLKKEITQANEAGTKFEITEKLEGSSMTCYLMDNGEGVQEFGVCSRNLNLKETEGNSFWATARAEGIEEKMRSVHTTQNFAIQGELVGPGVQDNIYGLSKLEFYVFDIYNITGGCYLKPEERRKMVETMGLKHVPVIAATADLYDTLGITDIPQLLDFADGKSVIGFTGHLREGVVFKEVDGGFTFKAISNKYLLGEK
jgi:RNA ligase (TIGR02306 family)